MPAAFLEVSFYLDSLSFVPLRLCTGWFTFFFHCSTPNHVAFDHHTSDGNPPHSNVTEYTAFKRHYNIKVEDQNHSRREERMTDQR